MTKYSEYKVGDRVRVTREGFSSEGTFVPLGARGVLIYVCEFGCHTSVRFHGSRLEKAEMSADDIEYDNRCMFDT